EACGGDPLGAGRGAGGHGQRDQQARRGAGSAECDAGGRRGFVNAQASSAAGQGVRPGWPGVIKAYASRIPIPEGAEIVTLGEGNTPLLFAPHLSELTGCTVYLKVEGANPTGSFKDRGMTVAITHAKASGVQAVICASTGNTSASAAAYATRAGLTTAVLVPQG